VEAIGTLVTSAIVIAVVAFSNIVLTGGYRKRREVSRYRLRAAYIIEAIALAMAYFFLSTLLFSHFRGDRLASVIGNFVLIVIVIVLDRVAIAIRRRVASNASAPESRTYAILWWLAGPSWKASLYLFYVFILACQALLYAKLTSPFLQAMTEYISTVYFGLLILVALDKFVGLMRKEEQTTPGL
jgi:hypothetical protein